MFTWEIQNVKIAEFCRKVPKVDLQESVWCVSWIRDDVFDKDWKRPKVFTVFYNVWYFGIFFNLTMW